MTELQVTNTKVQDMSIPKRDTKQENKPIQQEAKMPTQGVKRGSSSNFDSGWELHDVSDAKDARHKIKVSEKTAIVTPIK